jgi:hypothetical protein
LRTPRLRPSSGSKTSRNDESKHAAVVTRGSSAPRKPSLSCRGSPFHLTYKKGHRQCGGSQPPHSALEQEAELSVTKQQLHKALAAQKLTSTSRKVLSRARQATRQDLLNARYAREYAESGGHGRKGKGKGKAKQTKAAKGKGAKRATDEDTVRLDDKEVERQVEELMRLDARRFWRLFFLASGVFKILSRWVGVVSDVYFQGGTPETIGRVVVVLWSSGGGCYTSYIP